LNHFTVLLRLKNDKFFSPANTIEQLTNCSVFVSKFFKKGGPNSAGARHPEREAGNPTKEMRSWLENRGVLGVGRAAPTPKTTAIPREPKNEI
jgi:hypothetical protein